MKSEYKPDKWLVVKITPKEQKSFYKVFGVWHGDYTSGDSWRMNSGVIKATKEKSGYCFEGSSGSIYKCHKVSYGTNTYGESILKQLIDKAESTGGEFDILPEETNWLEIDYEN